MFVKGYTTPNLHDIPFVPAHHSSTSFENDISVPTVGEARRARVCRRLSQHRRPESHNQGQRRKELTVNVRTNLAKSVNHYLGGNNYANAKNIVTGWLTAFFQATAAPVYLTIAWSDKWFSS
jgi:hypothetical protein